MALGLILGLGRAFRRKHTSSLDILSSKVPQGTTTRGRIASPLVSTLEKQGKLPNYVVPDLTDFKVKPYVSQCSRDVKTSDSAGSTK